MATLQEKLDSLPKLEGTSEEASFASERRDQWIRLMRVDLRKAQEEKKRGGISEEQYKRGVKKIFSALSHADAKFWIEAMRSPAIGFRKLDLFTVSYISRKAIKQDDGWYAKETTQNDVGAVVGKRVWGPFGSESEALIDSGE